MITVVGIGADGWAGLGAGSRTAIAAAGTLLGSRRQLDLVPPEASGADRELLPSPLLPGLESLTSLPGLVVLASGDPMLHGIGATLVRRLGASGVRILPAVSSVSLAAARLGWALAEVTVVSCVTAPAETVLAHLAPGRRLLVLARDGGTAVAVREQLDAAGWGPSELTVLSELGGPAESVSRHAGGRTADLSVLAITCTPEAATWAGGPGLPDPAFASDGALTRREVRLLVLSSLQPAPGQLLWDVGAGSGSVAVEWLRAEPLAHAVAVEPRADRCARISQNASVLGVPRLSIVTGRAPEALTELPQPQAVFIGGGLTATGVVDACWAALGGGGRLVATAVTIESEALLHDWAKRVGGTLVRLELSRADPLGSFTTWRPELPIVVWSAAKP